MKAVRRLAAVAQVNQNTNVEANFSKIARMTEEAAIRGAKLICFPENCNFFGQGVVAAAQPLSGVFMARYKELAKKHAIWVSLGGFQEASAIPKKYHNTHVLLTDTGDIAATYQKLHLFNVQVSATSKFSESDAVEAGKQITPPVDTPVGKVGLSICYDVRFPEMYRKLTDMGAEVLLAPSAFLEKTGYAHWEPLLRARAIENQCYLLAAAQTGPHSPTRTNYGHSCIIDPWGCVVAMASEPESVIYAEIDLEYLHEVRRRIPCLEHRRRDLY